MRAACPWQQLGPRYLHIYIGPLIDFRPALNNNISIKSQIEDILKLSSVGLTDQNNQKMNEIVVSISLSTNRKDGEKLDYLVNMNI